MIDTFHQIACRAGEAILYIYNASTSVASEAKGDGSPLTAADRRAHELISQALGEAFPTIPVLSEEGVGISWKERQTWEKFLLVDPLDGTREFISRNGDFTVNIALIERGAPVCGLVHIPVSGVSYAAARGEGAVRIEGEAQELMRVSSPQAGRAVRVVGSRSHASPELATFLEQLPGAELASRGSALKLCLVAEGSADVYPRHGPTSLWDIAAGHCVIAEAGGYVCDAAAHDLMYGHSETILNPPFIAGAFDREKMAELFRQSLTSSR